ncbi:wall-associated receptor kinase-like 9 [Pistacia vera]|uniref:wall-associated receptor kinase-like 9 n=1 Tax=Pistacia vera TaxID=55513 RepID=UPI0012634A6E|nr:wall-associated receptor kinase-like 9 [Pistacia vera]
MQVKIVIARQNFHCPSRNLTFNISANSTNGDRQQQCKYASLEDQQWFQKNLQNPQEIRNMTQVPVVLDWGIYNSSFNFFASNQSMSHNSTSYCEISDNTTSSSSQFPTVRCQCLKGFQGNPYVLEGCEDIDECRANMTICGSKMICKNLMGGYQCISLTPKSSKTDTVILAVAAGLACSAVLFGTCLFCSMIRKRKKYKLREKFFIKNGGLLIVQTFSSSSMESFKLFCLEELEKATDHFNVNRTLGRGSQGTVYMGMLTDGRIVAVKKSDLVNTRNIEWFIHEVVILSKVHHRNLVKLLGCCLETEVPLLVYEYMPNGTLSQYLHDRSNNFQFTWDMCLRIAKEVASGLSYLHKELHAVICHRDLKSTNIFLDDNYTAKLRLRNLWNNFL